MARMSTPSTAWLDFVNAHLVDLVGHPHLTHAPLAALRPAPR
jgi:hypothetical protein